MVVTNPHFWAILLLVAAIIALYWYLAKGKAAKKNNEK